MAEFMEIPAIPASYTLSARVMLPHVMCGHESRVTWPCVTWHMVTCHMAMCHVSHGHVSRVIWPCALWLLYFQWLLSLLCVAMSHVSRGHVSHAMWPRVTCPHVTCHVMTCHMAMFHVSHGHVHYDCYISNDCSACYVWPWVTCNMATWSRATWPCVTWNPLPPSRINISLVLGLATTTTTQLHKRPAIFQITRVIQSLF